VKRSLVMLLHPKAMSKITIIGFFSQNLLKNSISVLQFMPIPKLSTQIVWLSVGEQHQSVTFWLANDKQTVKTYLSSKSDRL